MFNSNRGIGKQNISGSVESEEESGQIGPSRSLSLSLEVSGAAGPSETIEHTNSQTDVFLRPFVIVSEGRGILRAA